MPCVCVGANRRQCCASSALVPHALRGFNVDRAKAVGRRVAGPHGASAAAPAQVLELRASFDQAPAGWLALTRFVLVGSFRSNADLFRCVRSIRCMPHLAELDLNFWWSAVSAGALAEALPALTALTGLKLSSRGDALCAPAIAAVSRCRSCGR